MLLTALLLAASCPTLAPAKIDCATRTITIGTSAAAWAEDATTAEILALAQEMIAGERLIADAPRIDAAVEAPRVFQPDPAWRQPVRALSIAGVTLGSIGLATGAALVGIGGDQRMLAGGGAAIGVSAAVLTASIIGIVLSKKKPAFSISVTHQGLYASGNF